MENKTGKYLKYAFGEVLLVMIGILLAVQVNNWNNKRQKNQLEKTILLQINDDIEKMLVDIKGDHETLKMSITSHLNIQNYFEQDLEYNDTMCFDFDWLIQDEYIYPISSGYDNLKGEGLDLIKNDTIRTQIQRAFEYVLPRISKQNPFYPDLEEFFSEFYQNNFTPNKDSTLVYKYQLYGENFKYPYKDSFEDRVFNVYRGYVPNNFSELKTNSKFKVLMSQANNYRTWKFSRYSWAIQLLEDLEKRINEELDLSVND